MVNAKEHAETTKIETDNCQPIQTSDRVWRVDAAASEETYLTIFGLWLSYDNILSGSTEQQTYLQPEWPQTAAEWVVGEY